MDQLRIIVLGYMVRGPLGGLAWHHLQFVMGLARLGHCVHFLEDSDDYPSCYDPIHDVTDKDPAYGLQFAGNVFERAGLADCWAYHDAHSGQWLGPSAVAALDRCADADLLLNLSGINPLRPWFLEIPVRVLVDTDPVFTQLRHLTNPCAHEIARLHTAFFSFGENVQRDGCGIPVDGLPWLPTRQPVVLDAWPVTPPRPHGRFTTIMQWDSYPAREYNGVRYGMKSESFRPYTDLPSRAGRCLELALGSPTAPLSRLRRRGWHIRDPRRPSRDPWSYQRYIQRSKAEFSVAKHGYVISRSGWFSERSAGYLASGRPIVVEDTGFTDWLPSGAGVLSFHTPDEALAGIEAVNGRYAFHCRAAREIAEAHFDARTVLTRLLESAMSSTSVARAKPAVEA
ncbi:MAG TPA: hypothetical protein VKU02_08270 [Gemmataceae bacterium]|nr:hypothetical protein [Gemmataceae bacterium]